MRPDLLHGTVICSHLDAEGFREVWFALSKPSSHFIQIVCDHDHPAIGNAQKLPRIRRLTIAARFVVELAGKILVG